MDKSDIEGILERAYEFIETNSVRGHSTVDDVMMVSPHTHSLDSVLAYIYQQRAEVGDQITQLLETRILDLRNEIDILAFLYQADEDSLARAHKAKQDIAETIRAHFHKTT